MAAKRVEKRLAWIRTQHGLDPNPPAGMTGHGVASLNSDEMRKLLKQLDPDVVAVYSTRILSRKTLAAVDAPLINYHAGFNPKYRRQHPAYWPLVAGDTENAGVTLHAVDAGVHTGGVIYQAPMAFDPQDKIASYQTLQAATGIPLFRRASADALSGYFETFAVDLPSQNRLPPRIWCYFCNGLSKGVW